MPYDSPPPRPPMPPVVDLRVIGQHPHDVTGDVTGDVPDAPPDGSLEAQHADAVAAAVGADDLFVLRRITPTGWTHLGGVGRGAAWAGVIEVDEPADGRLAEAVRARRPVRVDGAASRHVLGPYWAAGAALVTVGDDHLVVFGSTGRSDRLRDLSDDDLRSAARSAVTAVAAVSPARHLADEVEVLAAVTALVDDAPTALDEVLQHVCRTVTRALACEMAVIWLPSGRFVTLQCGDSLAFGSAQAASIAQHVLDGHDRGPLVVQDAATRPLPPPLGPHEGVASYLALPLGLIEGRGCLLVVHSTEQARGFTALCQQLAARLADSAGRLLDAAASRERLETALTSSQQHATLDPLTGVGNRRSWNDAVVDASRAVAAGAPFTVVTVDLDGLKAVNDSYGHFGGDELIVACAQALRGAVRGARDVVARLGGDEFGLLLAGSDTAPQLITERLRRSLDGVRTPSGLVLLTSIGAATCPPFGSLTEAVRRADAAMYVDKRSRQSSRVPR